LYTNAATLAFRRLCGHLEATRRGIHDPHLDAADQDQYLANLRAINIELMHIAIAKNYASACMDANEFIERYLNEHGLSAIELLRCEYNSAFGSSSTDGVEQMALLFAHKLTGSKMSSAALQSYYHEFYNVLRTYFEEFKSITLVARA